MKGVITITSLDLSNINFNDFFDVWIEYRRAYSSVKPKTIKEDIYLYKKYILGSDFLYIPISELKVKHLLDYFRLITKNRTLTKKLFNNIKSILNGMFYYAIELEIRQDNPINSISSRQFAYKPINTNIEAYTEQERDLLLANIPDDNIYDLAIKLFFFLTVRVGELFAFSYDDIHNDTILVNKFVNYKKVIENDVKGHCNTGIRYLPLQDYAIEIINKIKLLNPNSKYLFVINDKPLDKGTLNRHLKKHCDRLNIKYRSSHKIRFGVASILFNKGVSPADIQYLLGHSSLNMTLHYLRIITSKSSLFNQVNGILDIKQKH